MAAVRYCANPEPHAGHEWIDDQNYAVVGGIHQTSYFYCWGVREDDHLSDLMQIVARHENGLRVAREALSRASLGHRRTERQFYEGDNAPEEYDDAESR